MFCAVAGRRAARAAAARMDAGLMLELRCLLAVPAGR